MLLIRALELADIPFEQNSYPEENHGLGGVRRAVYHNFDRFWSECFGHDLTWCSSTATVCWKVYSIANVTRIRNIYWFCYNEKAMIFLKSAFFNFSCQNFFREAGSSEIPKFLCSEVCKNSLIKWLRLNIVFSNLCATLPTKTYLIGLYSKWKSSQMFRVEYFE